MTQKYLPLLCLTLLINACAGEHAAGVAPMSDLGAPVVETAATSQAGHNLYLYALARLRSAEGDQEGALIVLRQALQGDPDAPFLHTTMAQVLLQQNRAEEALAECQAAIKLDPTFLQAQQLCGNILMSMQREKEAIPYFKKVMELDPTKEEVYLHVAIFYLKNFEYEQAVDTLK